MKLSRPTGRKAKIGSKKANPKVFSYHSQRQETDRTTKRVSSYSPRQRLKRTLTLLIILAILAGISYMLWLSPKPKVVLIKQPDSVYRTNEAYAEGVNQVWGSSLNNLTKLTLNISQNKAEILNKFPELESVDVQIPIIGKQTTVVLTPATPKLHLISAQGSFYIRSDGIVMARSDQLSANNLKNIPVVEDKSNLKIESGKYVLSGKQTQFIATVYEAFVANNMEIEQLTLPPVPLELDVKIKGLPYYIKFNLDGVASEGVGEYLAAKAKFDNSGQQPAEYVDLRVKGKVFYK